tara:strand:- start:1278 stop:1667 length:390 start_codon:yes stop_codon:yes gene_type:complete
MKKYLSIVLMVGVWSCEDAQELPYLNLRSINIAYNPSNSNLINEDSYYISDQDSLGKILTTELLGNDTNLVANMFLPNLCHHIHYYKEDGIVIYSKYLGNPTADAYTITLNLGLREENSTVFTVSYNVK